MYATLLLPNFRLQAALRFAPPPWHTEPVALLDSQIGRTIILEVSSQAAQQGACPGMSPAQALARCPALKLLPPCPDSERNTQEALLQVAWTLSPKVESPHPGRCTADLRTCRQKPKDSLLHALKTLSALHLSAKAGLAPSARLALLAAHQAKPLLCVENGATFAASLPLAVLTQDSTLLETLAQWGVHTAGALLKLPRQQALERLGLSGHALWEAARGEGDRPLRLEQEPVVYEESLAFEQEIETLEPLLFILNRLLEALLRRIKCTARLVSGLQLRLALENRTTHQRPFTVPAPCLDAAVLLGILETHLEQLRLDHRPVAVSLRLETTQPKSCALDLFEPVLRDPNRFGETLARLCALLGEEHVGIPCPSPDHFRDRVQMEAASALYQQKHVPMRKHTPHLRGLPLHRLRPAPSAMVEFIDSKPAHIQSEAVSGKILESRGPYRFSGHWWDTAARNMEEWDIFVSPQQGRRRGTALARIGTPSDTATGTNREPAAWRLEGFYNSPADTS
jgi:protein ImuB